ncbi:MAG: RHS repeat-associated core domain-containing protein, partial [Gemmatimonadetes bacterium]|nr:RHS repeat-associated core domain-containing protein [Gemmatimonadota bacterium]
KSVGYEYDSRNRVTRLISPDGSNVDYTYTNDDLIETVTDSAGTTTYAYDDARQVAQRTLANGVVTSHGYDPDGRLTNLVHRKSGDQLLLGFAYTLDAVGNRTRMDRISPAGTNTTLYGYDKLYRLTHVAYPEGRAVEYEYDGAGNRTLMVEALPTDETNVTAYVYDQANQLVTSSLDYFDAAGGVQSNVTTHFEFDDAGRLVSQSNQVSSFSFEYDYEDRLVAWEHGTSTRSYTYNGNGVRVAEGIDGVVHTIVQDVVAPHERVLEASDALNGEGAYTRVGGSPMAFRSADGDVFFLTDALGSVVAEVDENQELRGSFFYDAFGSSEGDLGVHGSLPRFASEEHDPSTGLIYLRARYYDVSVGRFLSRDRMQGGIFRPQDRNPYVYCKNRPNSLVDPSGKMVLDDDYWAREEARRNEVDRIYDELDAESTNNHPVSEAISDVFNWGNARIRANYDQIGDALLGFAINVPGVSGSDVSSIYSHYRERYWPERQYLDLNPSDYRWDRFSRGRGRTTDFGGIYLNKAATYLGDLNEITGAAFDPATGQIILQGAQNVALPAMDIDDLAVAIRAVYELGEDPGVNIGGYAGTFEGDPVVQLFGGTENTRFGWTLFEADRLLKDLFLAKDNLTGATVNPGVSGYSSIFDRHIASGNYNTHVGRKWFEPDEVVMARSDDGGAMVFETATLACLTEYKEPDWNGTVIDNPDHAAFAQHIQDHFDEFASAPGFLAHDRQPSSWSRTKQLMQVVALVKWMKENDIPLDLSWIENYEIAARETPVTTPYASRSGSGLNMYGG